MDVLNNDALLKKLNESTISIHTVEIQSTCKVHQVLKKFSLPSYLKVLRIRGNSLNIEDVTALLKFLHSVNYLHELDLCRTKFKERTFFIFISALNYSKDITSLIFTDNSLTEQEINGLITVLESVKNLKTLNLSKSILTETQANAILHKHEQAKNIVSLNLSYNAIQGNEIVVGICQLPSLQELDLSHNCVRFSPLPNFEAKRNYLSTCLKVISLSSNHMKPDDITQFCSLIRSDLLELNLDFNHIGRSIWSLCLLGERIKNLKVLSLANTNICDNVDGLAFLLSLVRELEDLNLSCNNLLAEDFQQLQTPLSKLTLLKTLNLSMNAIGSDGMKAIADIFKDFPLLERLDMNSSYIREDEVSVLCKSLASLKKLKYLNLSGICIDAEVLDDALVLPATLEELLFSDIIHGKKLFDEMRHLINLRKLHLNKLILRVCDAEALIIMLPCFSKLEELSLASLVAPECQTILTAIKSLKNIKKIDLNSLKLSNEEALVDMLSSLLFLEELVLADMRGANMDYVSLFSGMKLLKRLRLLSLGGVNMSYNRSKDFCDMLSCLSILKDIVFPDVKISFTGSDRIPGFFDALDSLRYVRSLDMGGINIREQMIADLARVLPSLQLLEKLKIKLNMYCESNVKLPNELLLVFGKLKYLKELSYVSGGKYRVSGRDALAEVLASLQLLEKLELDFSLEIDDCKQLSNALGKLRYLKEFSFFSKSSARFIPKAGIQAFSHALSSLQLLEKLTLRIEESSEHVRIEQLCAALGDLKYLRKLDLYFWEITNSAAEALTKMLPSLELLEELKLRTFMRRHRVDSERKKQVLAAIGNLKYLKKLNFSMWCPSIDIDHEACFAKMLSSLRLTLLEKPNIKWIEISQSETKELFIAVGKLKYLKKLKLSCNIHIGISQNNVDALVRALLSMQMLENLQLKSSECRNKIKSRELFIAVGKLKHLKKLDLSWLGKITRSSVDALIQALLTLRVLEKLRLEIINGSNESQGKGLLIAIGKLKYLKKLYLDWEGITQTNVDALAKTLISLQVLEKLKLSVAFCCRHDCNAKCDHQCDDKCDDECVHDLAECRRNCHNECEEESDDECRKCHGECDEECDEECDNKCDRYCHDHSECDEECDDECRHYCHDPIDCDEECDNDCCRRISLLKTKVLNAVKTKKYFRIWELFDGKIGIEIHT